MRKSWLTLFLLLTCAFGQAAIVIVGDPAHQVLDVNPKFDAQFAFGQSPDTPRKEVPIDPYIPFVPNTRDTTATCKQHPEWCASTADHPRSIGTVLEGESSTVHRSWFSRHQTALALSFIAAGVASGIWLAKHEAHCGHYEYGQSGVNWPCPK